MDNDRVKQRLDEEKNRLEDLRSKLDATEVRETPEAELAGELSSYDQHPADEGSETFEKGKVLAQLEQIEVQLGEIEQALARVEDGSYGKCEVCGVEIPEERLEELPASRRCIEHQREMERSTNP